MNFYDEGRQARRDGDYERARELYEEGTAQKCVKCAFELVMWEIYSIFSFPKARRVCTEANYVPFLMQKLPYSMSNLQMDILTRESDYFSRGLYFYHSGQKQLFHEYIHKSWKEQENPHAALILNTPESLEFATCQGLALGCYALYSCFSQDVAHLRMAAKQGIKRALITYTRLCWDGNVREGAQLILFWHTHDCRLETCELFKRLPQATDPVELHEYGKYICYQGIPVCLMNVSNAILARNIYLETYTRCKQTVLYWMWTRLLPRDLMLLIGRHLIWDTCRDDPHLWRESPETPLKK